MKAFHLHTLPDASILALGDIKEKFQIDPIYQRPGGIWTLKKKQLFIDSIINGYDIPKFYLHKLTDDPQGKEYSIIDGRQRLEAIWDFVLDKFTLADDFTYYENESFNAAGMNFSQIARQYPKLLIKFHARQMTVMVVYTDDIDFIEDMFSRLNEAVPLNAAERRNAFGGPLPVIIREVAEHRFFSEKVSFSSTRYRHYDVAAKLLLQRYHWPNIVDTKKARLDDFVRAKRTDSTASLNDIKLKTNNTLDVMCRTFLDKDVLLRSSGMTVVYFLLFSSQEFNDLDRSNIVEFEDKRALNRKLFANESSNVNYKWIEFDELAQSSNDGAAIRERVTILTDFLKEKLAYEDLFGV